MDEILEEIRNEAVITSPTLIAGAFYDLITKETPAHYFVQDLAERGAGEKMAKSIAKAIKERILESERYSLFRWGVDISEIKVEDAPNLETLGLREDLRPEETKKTLHPESIEKKEQEIEEIPIIRSTFQPPAEKKETGSMPFVLQERPKEESALSGQATGIIPSLSFGFFKSKKVKPIISPQPIKARIETPEAETPKGKKVVHYMESRSTASPFEAGGEFLRTEEIATPAPKEEVPKKPADNPFLNAILKKPPEKSSGKKTEAKIVSSGPKIEGNTIDLRNN